MSLPILGRMHTFFDDQSDFHARPFQRREGKTWGYIAFYPQAWGVTQALTRLGDNRGAIRSR